MKRWTEIEIAYLRANEGLVSPTDMGIALRRSRKSVVEKLDRIKGRFRKQFERRQPVGGNSRETAVRP